MTATVHGRSARVETTCRPERRTTDVPRHVAIIMDGNRRWARERGVPEAQGHAAGVEAIRPIVEHASAVGVEVLTIYAFSRENWAARQRTRSRRSSACSRPPSATRRRRLVEEGVRVRLLGRHRGAAAADPRVHRGGPRGHGGRARG